MTQEEQIWSVSQLNNTICELLEDGFFPLWLKGEVGNLTIHRSGHVYFTLKDDTSQIKIVYFKGSKEAQQLDLHEGQEIEAFGQLSVYQPRGNYQLNISQIRLIGIGDLQKKFNELKEKLYKEGLFDQQRKKAIPLFPQKIGVITSPQGAAIQDFINIIQRRFNSLEVVIYPVAVQGKGAANKLAEAVHWFNQRDDFDAIIITRGGGSLEDLWEFNEEILARAIADSILPVISAVGHEVDFSICDFVADLRVPTPSAAAEIIIAKKSDFINTVNSYKQRLNKQLHNNFTATIVKYQFLQNRFKIKSPLHRLQTQQQRLDEINGQLTFKLTKHLNHYQQKLLRIKNTLDSYSPKPIWGQKNNTFSELRYHFATLKKELVQINKQKIALLKQKLDLINPKNILKRGYAIIQNEKGKIIQKSQDAKIGERLIVNLVNGKMKVRKEEDDKQQI